MTLQQAFTHLSAGERERMLMEIHPKASGAMVAQSARDSITQEWCGFTNPDQRQAATSGGEIAGFVFVEDTETLSTVSCVTTVPTVNKAIEYYGGQRGDDISQAETGYFGRKDICGSVLVPMLKSEATELKFLYDEHDLSTEYSGTRSTSMMFKWPNEKGLDDHFEVIEAGDKVVLASMPAVMPYAFGAKPVEGKIEDSANTYAEMDNSMGEGLNLKAVYNAILLLKENGGHSFHVTADGDDRGGVNFTLINSDFITRIGGRSALKDTIFGKIDYLDRRSRDGKKVNVGVTKWQDAFAIKWIEENPEEAKAYVKIKPVGGSGKEATTRTKRTSFRSSDSEEEDLAKETPKRIKKGISKPRAIGKMGLELLLSTHDDDETLVPGQVNDLLEGGFQVKEDLTNQMYEGHREAKILILTDYNQSAYRNLVLPPMTKVFMGALLSGHWSTVDPYADKKGSLSLGAYFPLEDQARKTIEDNIDEAQADIDVEQATHNRTKIQTTLHKSWAFKNMWQLVTALKGFNAELLIASKKCKIRKDTALDSTTKPLLCLYNEVIISTMESKKGIDWYKGFKSDHNHLAVSMAHKIGACLAKICNGAFDYSTNLAAQNGTMPAEDSEFMKGLANYSQFHTMFQELVQGGDVGAFGHATTLYKIAFPTPPPSNGGGGGRNQGGGSGRNGNVQQQQAGGRGRGGRGGGGGGRGQGEATTNLHNNPSGLTAPKLFVRSNPGGELSFRDIRFPSVRCNGNVGFLCGAAHIVGMNCTRPQCRFLHLPVNGLEALDTIGRERVNLCIRNSTALDHVRGQQAPTATGAGTGGTGASGATVPPGGGASVISNITGTSNPN